MTNTIKAQFYYKIPNRVGLSHYTDSILLCDQGDAAALGGEVALAYILHASVLNERKLILLDIRRHRGVTESERLVLGAQRRESKIYITLH